VVAGERSRELIPQTRGSILEGYIQWRSDGVGRVDKVQGAPESAAPEFQAKIIIFSVTVKIRTSGYQKHKKRVSV